MQCVLYPVDNVYCAVHCALCTVNCTITVPCALCTIHCTGHCTQCTMYTALVTAPCALSTTLVTVYNVHCTGHCTLCTVHCTGHWQGGGGGGSVSATSGSFEPRPKLPVSKTVGGKTRPEIYLSLENEYLSQKLKNLFQHLKAFEGLFPFMYHVRYSVSMRFVMQRH